MNVRRGDVVLAFYPFASGSGGSRRPALVVQSDLYNQRIRNTIVAQITTNLRRANDPAHLLISAASPEGQRAGLLHDSVVSCTNLATLDETRIDRVIGALDAATIQQIDACLKVALGIP
jgi:mRNA interferase MazF